MASALELLTNDSERKNSYLFDKWAPISCGLFGFISVCYINWGSRRPVFSGIPKHILAVVSFAALGKIVDDYRNEYLAERDAVLRHYVELHPEDFPTPERKKLSEVLLPWIPIR